MFSHERFLLPLIISFYCLRLLPHVSVNFSRLFFKTILEILLKFEEKKNYGTDQIFAYKKSVTKKNLSKFLLVYKHMSLKKAKKHWKINHKFFISTPNFRFWRNFFLTHSPFSCCCCCLNSCVWLSMYIHAKPEVRRFKNSIHTNIARRGAPRQIFIFFVHVCIVSTNTEWSFISVMEKCVLHSSWHWIGFSDSSSGSAHLLYLCLSYTQFKMLMLRKYSQIYMLIATCLSCMCRNFRVHPNFFSS